MNFLKKHPYLTLTIVIILVVVWLLLIENGEYGAALFFAIPSSISFLIGYDRKYTETPNSLLKAGLFAFLKVNVIILILCGALIAIGLEGFICVLMAYPFLVIPMTISYIIGLFIAHADKSIQRNSLIFLVIFNPATYIYDSYTIPIQEEVTSTLIINTSKDAIWNDLTTEITFTNTPNRLFKEGVSYPKSIALKKTNKELSYNCITNNDTIILQITEFKNNHSVTFKPKEQTIPMRELTPYNSIDAKHLHHYFFVHFGKIKLEALSNHSTKITATTLYSYKIAPKWYWKLWSNYIIDQMQLHVLNSINSKYVN
ncbi:hypothetical protein [Olleya sp. R77988]|uniref:hypothetical protein n=1 Tax=Olleya sp. R77988 TaxID=3093875 RepID=UPI0037CABB52